ncbi:translation initiation factor IF-2-like isoform X2 [Nycticebus coucang]|uniref:translation initiation factor IF-2-like isoform X2 n=1 Tax=Nycticebus coucang TaxID=9470 RepID=UPI00234E2C44|nr:translation initiation factor IF-2-like isoform X2 [Nycticebus coucang]
MGKSRSFQDARSAIARRGAGTACDPGTARPRGPGALTMPGRAVGNGQRCPRPARLSCPGGLQAAGHSRGKDAPAREICTVPPQPPAGLGEGASHNAQRAPARTSAVRPPTGGGPGGERTPSVVPRDSAARSPGRARGGAGGRPVWAGSGAVAVAGARRGPISSGRARAGGRGQGLREGRARSGGGGRGVGAGAGARVGLTDGRTDGRIEQPRRARTSDPPGRSALPAAAVITGLVQQPRHPPSPSPAPHGVTAGNFCCVNAWSREAARGRPSDPRPRRPARPPPVQPNRTRTRPHRVCQESELREVGEGLLDC